MENYETLEKAGEGCFGSVHVVRHKVTGSVCALKRIPVLRLDEGLPHNVAREVLIAERAEHKNICRVREVFAHGASICIVSDRCDLDLQQLLRRFTWDSRLPLWLAKSLMQDLLRALRYLHERSIVHRDVKPSNCLITSSCSLKLADFGLARLLSAEDMTHEVATRWYRAPELLFGSRRYDGKVDVWGAGCILAELLNGTSHSTLFCGDGDIDQISRIFSLLGTPTVESWPEHVSLPDWGKIMFAPIEGNRLANMLSDADPCGLDLLNQMLCLNPSKRMSACEALRHPWFTTVPLPAIPKELPSPLVSDNGPDECKT